MSTFAEIAEEARLVATSQPLGSIDYARMIARLAEAMAVLEYNLAVQMAGEHMRGVTDPNVFPMLRENFLQLLRKEIPEEG